MMELHSTVDVLQQVLRRTELSRRLRELSLCSFKGVLCVAEKALGMS